MSELAWSLTLDGIGLIPLMLSRYKRRSAWVWSIALMGLWTVYAIDRGGYGFIPGATIYTIVYIGNYRRWKQDDVEAAGAQG